VVRSLALASSRLRPHRPRRWLAHASSGQQLPSGSITALRLETLVKRLLARLLVTGVLLSSVVLVAPPAAQAHDQGTCITSASYVECIFVKHGLTYVVNKLSDSAGAQYKCAYSRIRYYNGSGGILETVYGPETCAVALQYTDYTGPYERTAKKVCVWWYVSYPKAGNTPTLCRYAPW
jgi:hypothetical protein